MLASQQRSAKASQTFWLLASSTPSACFTPRRLAPTRSGRTWEMLAARMWDGKLFKQLSLRLCFGLRNVCYTFYLYYFKVLPAPLQSVRVKR